MAGEDDEGGPGGARGGDASACLELPAEVAGRIDALLVEASATRTRRGLVLSGSTEWARAAGLRVVERVTLRNDAAAVMWAGPRCPPGWSARSWVRPTAVRRLLGDEADVAVIDLTEGLDLDGVAVTAGAVRAGGLWVALLPPETVFVASGHGERLRIEGAVAPAGRVPRRLLRTLVGAPGLARWSEGGRLVEGPTPSPPERTLEWGGAAAPVLNAPAWHATCRTPDQLEAVAAVLRATAGRARAPAMLLAHRGRGKSTALGIAAAELLRAGRSVRVTAPAGAAVATLFGAAARGLGLDPSQAGRTLRWGAATLTWRPVGDVLASPSPVEVLFIDEAAAIPLPVLDALSKRASRLAYASTVEGYEGTGRALIARFCATLAERHRGFRPTRLVTPIRWAAPDPVETWVRAALLLDADDAPAPALGVAGAALHDARRVARLDRDRLAEDEPLLRAVFGLLLGAHYRTGPADLARLLDAPNAAVLAAWAGDEVVGAAWVQLEGALPPEVGAEVLAGRRRPVGHLLPEVLAVQAGASAGVSARLVRVVRVAVAASGRRRGVGRALIAAAEAAWPALDAVGSVFGATPELLAFWRASGFSLAHLGSRRGARSGAHSATVLRACSPLGTRLAADAAATLGGELLDRLGGDLADLGVDEVRALLAAARSGPPAPLSAADGAAVEAIISGVRSPDLRPRLLRAVAADALAIGAAVAPEDAELLVRCLIQRRPWPVVVTELGLPGQAEAVARLRGALGALRSAATPVADAGRRD